MLRPQDTATRERKLLNFATMPGIKRVGGNKMGVFTRDRQPKAAAHVVRQRWLKQT